jgi:hypothetical protein
VGLYSTKIRVLVIFSSPTRHSDRQVDLDLFGQR